jgi:hypothetical protein
LDVVGAGLLVGVAELGNFVEVRGDFEL